MDMLDYESSNERIMRLDNKRVGIIYPIIYRKTKTSCVDVVDSLLGFLINHNTSEKQSKCYEALLYNLVYAYLFRGCEGVLFSKNKKSYHQFHIINGRKCKSKIYYQGAIDFLDLMKKLGYLTSLPGGSLGSHGYKPGYVLFTDKFKYEVNDSTDLGIVPTKDLVRLKTGKLGEYSVFKETSEIRAMIELTQDYNKMMEAWSVSLNGVPINSDIYRLFLGSMNYYARWHGDFQIIPSEKREDLTFNLQSTKEIDFQASHITIMYAIKGIDISDLDPYNPENIKEMLDDCKLDLQDFNLTRKDLKWFILMMINCDSIHSAILALVNEKSLNCKFGRKHKFYKTVIESLLEFHQEIKDLFFVPKFSLTLMKYESEVMEGILQVCVKKNLPILPIHDSVVCMEEHVELVNQIMLDSFYSKWHVQCTTKIK